MGIFDLPAKAAVLCFNGEFGCSVCLHPGKRLPNNARVYLPSAVYAETSHSQVISDTMEAEKTNTFVQGIIGLSSFASTFDLVVSVPVDYMHACCIRGCYSMAYEGMPSFMNHLSTLVVVFTQLIFN